MYDLLDWSKLFPGEYLAFVRCHVLLTLAIMRPLSAISQLDWTGLDCSAHTS